MPIINIVTGEISMDSNQLIKQPFGLNIALPQRTIKEVQQVAKQEIENITINPFLNLINEKYSVSPEQLATDLRKAQSQIYTLGQVMREGQSGTSLNMKF